MRCRHHDYWANAHLRTYFSKVSLFHFCERSGGREQNKDLPSGGSHPKCLQQSRPGQTKNSIQVSCLGGRDQSTQATSCQAVGSSHPKLHALPLLPQVFTQEATMSCRGSGPNTDDITRGGNCFISHLCWCIHYPQNGLLQGCNHPLARAEVSPKGWTGKRSNSKVVWAGSVQRT